jgi:hypothetical protein
VELVYGTMLDERDQPLQHIDFPLTDFISRGLVAGHPLLEMELIGSEGMLGATQAPSARTKSLSDIQACNAVAWP